MAVKSYQIEKNISLEPLAKDYVKALVNESMDGLKEEVKLHFTELKALIADSNMTCSCTPQVDDLQKKMAYLESRYKEDDKFTLTKAKMIKFMVEEGIK